MNNLMKWSWQRVRLILNLILVLCCLVLVGLLAIGIGITQDRPEPLGNPHRALLTELDHLFLGKSLEQHLSSPSSHSEQGEEEPPGPPNRRQRNMRLLVSQVVAEIDELRAASGVPDVLFDDFYQAVDSMADLAGSNTASATPRATLGDYIVAQSKLLSALDQDEINRSFSFYQAFRTTESVVVLSLFFVVLAVLALCNLGYLLLSKRVRLLDEVLDSIPDPIVAKDYDGNFTYSNSACALLYNTTPEEMIGRDDGYFTGNHEQADFFRQNVREIMRRFEMDSVYEDSTDANSGEVRHFLSLKIPYKNYQDELNITVVAKDITEIAQLKNTAERNEKRLESIFEVSGEGLWEWNTNTNEVNHNAQWEQITGVAESENSFKEFEQCIIAEDRPRVFAALDAMLQKNETYNIEFRMRRPDGKVIWIWDRGQIAERDSEGRPVWIVGIMQDITHEKYNQDKIENLAFYDSLTQLPNRSLLKDRLRESILLHSQRNLYGAVLFLDMDRFKLLNDTYGHQVGDQLLVEVATRIKRQLRAEDTVSRFGGDEFIVVLHQLNDDAATAAEHAKQTAEQIRESLSEVFHLHHDNVKNVIDYFITVSIGGVVFKSQDADANALIQMADMALYKVKKDGRNDSVIFGPEMQKELNRERDVKRELRRSIAEKHFSVYYQPKYDENNKLIGAESLVRWLHPEMGMIPPTEFIGIAEQANLIVSIGDIVLHDACKKLQNWQQNRHTELLNLSVNISAKQIRQKDFVEHFTEIVTDYGINLTCLTLEVTETALLEDLDVAVEKLMELKKLGIRLSLDDFGTGYSSLSYLKGLPIDEIKIDRSFVRDIRFDESDLIMVKSILDLGRNFDIDVVSEGVEDIEQYSLLQSLGCRFYQGFYFSKPVPYTDFEHFISVDV